MRRSGFARLSRWIVLAATCLTLGGCGEREQATPAQPASSRPSAEPSLSRVIEVPPNIKERIRTQSVTARPIDETVTAPGEVTLDLKRVAKVTSRIEGQVEQVYVGLGDRVARGQPLVAVGSLQLDQLVQEYLVSKAQAEVAENAFRRTEKLRADDIVPERRLEEDRGRYREAKARYQHIREKLLNMGMTVEELRGLEQGKHAEGHRYLLRAPLRGTVVKQDVVLGQGVAPGTDLLEVVDTSRVWVFANLPIEQARRFKEGDIGTIVPKGGAPITAPLTYVAPVADDRTRTVRVRFEVANTGGGLKPNEYVEVRLALEGTAVLAVPMSALTTVGESRGVFAQHGPGFVFRPIEGGREGSGWLEVRSGVTAGEVIVIEGVFDLKNLLLKETIGAGE